MTEDPSMGAGPLTMNDIVSCICNKNMGGVGQGLGSKIRGKSSFGFGQTGFVISLAQPGGNVKSSVSQLSFHYSPLRSLLKSVFLITLLP